MAFTCIAAILPARIFPGVKVTLGKKGDPKKWPHSEAIDTVSDMGAVVEVKNVDSFTFDKQFLVFTTPAFMYEGTYYQIFEGIGNMIEALQKVMP